MSDIVPIISHYSLDLGFNIDAERNPGNKDEPLLWQGLTILKDSQNNPVARARKIRLPATLRVTIYDLSDKESRRQVDWMSLCIQFGSGKSGQPHTSPVGDGDDVFDRFKIFHRPQPNKSTVFDETLPVWFVLRGDENSPKFSSNQLQQVPRGIGDAVFDLKHRGSFYYTLLLKVGWHGGLTKTYRVDPEMITDDGGPEIDPEDKALLS